jgi:CheY-like chemotaxis protein
VHGIITEVAGVIQISSRPRRGTTFTIVLPATDEPLRQEERKAAGTHRGSTGETILICEDEPAIREVAQRILVRNGYEVILAADGLDAIRVARTRTDPLHLLLTGMVKPQVLGKNVAEAIRGIRSDIRVLFMSGYTEESLLAAVREALDA